MGFSKKSSCGTIWSDFPKFWINTILESMTWSLRKKSWTYDGNFRWTWNFWWTCSRWFNSWPFWDGEKVNLLKGWNRDLQLGMKFGHDLNHLVAVFFWFVWEDSTFVMLMLAAFDLMKIMFLLRITLYRYGRGFPKMVGFPNNHGFSY